MKRKKREKMDKTEHCLRSKFRILHWYCSVLTSYFKSYKICVFVFRLNEVGPSFSLDAARAGQSNKCMASLSDRENLASHLLSNSRRYKLGPDTLRKIPAPFSAEESKEKPNISTLMLPFTNDFCLNPTCRCIKICNNMGWNLSQKRWPRCQLLPGFPHNVCTRKQEMVPICEALLTKVRGNKKWNWPSW